MPMPFNHSSARLLSLRPGPGCPRARASAFALSEMLEGQHDPETRLIQKRKCTQPDNSMWCILDQGTRDRKARTVDAPKAVAGWTPHT